MNRPLAHKQSQRFGVACAAATALLCMHCKNGERDGTGREQHDPLRVAAAADLKVAFSEIGNAYEKHTGRRVVFSFGSTGLLAKQVAEGAPFDVFAAANLKYADDVVSTGACKAGTTQIYGRGRIVLWNKGPTPPAIDAVRGTRLAIANPDHAPYGKAAKEALVKLGIWEQVSKSVIYGENVQQTLQFADTGNTDLAIVALSLAKTSGGSYTPIDDSLYAPIIQALVLCKGQRRDVRPEAYMFAEYLKSETARQTMATYGFTSSPATSRDQ
jgi:molybdate transport system substrate-binding protein